MNACSGDVVGAGTDEPSDDYDKYIDGSGRFEQWYLGQGLFI